MDNNFPDAEELYRAVLPEEERSIFWKKDGTISSAALKDKKGLSVERGDFRKDETIVDEMSHWFRGVVICFSAKTCRFVDAKLLYKPTERSMYHSEIHGSSHEVVLSNHQSKYISKNARIIGKIG